MFLIYSHTWSKKVSFIVYIIKHNFQISYYNYVYDLYLYFIIIFIYEAFFPIFHTIIMYMTSSYTRGGFLKNFASPSGDGRWFRNLGNFKIL